MTLYEVLLQFAPQSAEWRSTGRIFDDYEPAKEFAKERSVPGIDTLIVERTGGSYTRVTTKEPVP